jgi:predicted dienelactone hydrolase
MKKFLLLIMLTTAIQPVFAESYMEDWTDAARKRTVPVRIYLPEAEQPGTCPIVLLSHGLGGSREGFPYLGEYWAKHGYVVIAMQHVGSDTEAVRRKPGKTVAELSSEAVNAENAQARVADVKFVLDELERQTKDDKKLKGRLDLDKIAIGGHSFGAHTTLSVAGRFPFAPEPRIKAAIAMSPASPVGVNPAGLHRNVKVPILHLTGTKDFSPIRPDTKPTDRRIPFDNISAPGQYLVIFKDGDHMLFSGHRRLLGLNRMEKECQPIIQETTLKFLDATLRQSSEAKEWLNGNGCTTLLGDRATFERKNENK